MSVITAFRHRIKIEEPELAPDDAGGHEKTWAEVDEVWGEIRSLTGSERIYADAFEGVVSHRISLRQPVAVSPRARLTCEDVVYDIVAAYDPDGQGKVLTCECVSRSR